MPLTGVRVLDLSRLLPGPFATMILAGLGAEVVKVEDLEGGDYMRWMPPLRDGTSVMFTAINRNKRSLRLDLKTARGRELFLELATRSHVILESFRPGVLDRLDLGLATLHACNPRLVVCSISGFGQDGPDRLRAGHDLNYLARAGVLSITGDADGRPVIPGVQMADLGGGAQSAVIAILAALRRAELTGEGSHCDVSMLDGMLSWMSPHIAAVQEGSAAGPGAMLLNGSHPCYHVYRCADGWVTVAALEPKFWARLCELLEVEELSDLAFATGAEAGTAVARLDSVFAGATRAEWRERLGAEDTCCEPVLSIDEMVDDPQVRHRAQDASGSLVWFPLRVGAQPHAPTGAAPGYGADSRALLAEVGVDDTEYASLVDAKVTG
ncbi:MAG TPA: CaiB/BaiF CoA-transferase family protein [Candidatus Deferrimicrobium sp.]|nr:CaiB/BaiF CoA-transferase family protein [Candidatus Deferrimicrobium sp.]